MISIVYVFGFFLSFFLLRYFHGLFSKDVYWKYIIWDSGITGLYSGIIALIMVFQGKIDDHEFILVYFLFGMVVIPIVYSTIKKHFIGDHPRIANWLYPVYEFIIFILGIPLGMFFSGVIGYLVAQIGKLLGMYM